MSALLDAWSVIDMCHRVRELIDQLPQLPRKKPWVKRLVLQSVQAEDLRHHIQHLRGTINDAEGSTHPVWGSLSWVPTTEPNACYTMFTGSLVDRHSVHSISYDTHECRYTAQIELSADKHVTVDLLAVARALEQFRADLIQWLQEKPQTQHSEGRTLVWRWSVLESPPGKKGMSKSDAACTGG